MIHLMDLNLKNQRKVNKCKVIALSHHHQLEKVFVLKFLPSHFQLKDYFHHRCQRPQWVRPCLHGDSPSGLSLIWLLPLANQRFLKSRRVSSQESLLVN